MAKVYITSPQKEAKVRDIARVCNCNVGLEGGDIKVSGSWLAVLKFKMMYKKEK